MYSILGRLFLPGAEAATVVEAVEAATADLVDPEAVMMIVVDAAAMMIAVTATVETTATVVRAAHESVWNRVC